MDLRAARKMLTVVGSRMVDKYGGGVGKYISWGYLPHEDKYNKPIFENRNAALIMKSGIYDGASDNHLTMSEDRCRENITHAWYDEATNDQHPFDRTTKAVNNNDINFEQKYWQQRTLITDALRRGRSLGKWWRAANSYND